MDWIKQFLDPFYSPSSSTSKKVTKHIFDDLYPFVYDLISHKLMAEASEIKESLSIEVMHILFQKCQAIRSIAGNKSSEEASKIVFSYLKAIIKNVVNNYLSKIKNERVKLSTIEEIRSSNGGFSDDGISGSEIYVFDEEKLGFRLGFVHFVLNNRLSKEDQLIIEKRFFTIPPLNYREIAGEIDRTEITIRQQYCRGLRRWREAIVKEAKLWLQNKKWKKFKEGDPLVLQQLIDDLDGDV